MTESCGVCGRTESGREPVLSRHHTSQGEIVYTRCLCGSVAVRLVAAPRAGDGELVARGPASPEIAPLLAAAHRTPDF